MLGQHYSSQFEEIVSSLRVDIALPDHLADFFSNNGEVNPIHNDDRQHQRLRARTKSVAYFERVLPNIRRPHGPFLVYTADFSKVGCGLLASIQLYPMENLRLLLPTFWVQLKVVRARRLSQHCYEIGTTLLARRDRSDDAFDLHWQSTAALAMDCEPSRLKNVVVRTLV